MRMAALFPEINAIVINPQTVITDYEFKNVERYLRICYDGRNRGEAIRDFPERLSIIENIESLKRSNIIYIQNVLDTHHYEMHYKPFCAALNASWDENRTDGNFRRLLFSHEAGHKKAETQEVFQEAMKIIGSLEFSGNKR